MSTTTEYHSQNSTADDPDTTTPENQTEDPRVKYYRAIEELSQFANNAREIEEFVDAAACELAWIAVTRGHSTVALGDILSRLSFFITKHSRYLEAQAELNEAKQAGQQVH